MAILGIGTDLVEVDRIRDLLARHGDRFKSKAFTADEISYCDRCADPAIHYAARFAAKEAAAKALGTGLWAEGVDWKHIEVRRAESGAPSLILHETALTHAENRGFREALVSLSHTSTLATAVVLLQSSD